MYKVLSVQISDNIDIKLFKGACSAELISSDSDELFYKVASEKYIYVFRYGVVSFLNHREDEIMEFVKLISPYCKIIFKPSINEEFEIEVNAKENKFGHNKIEVMHPTADVLRLIMLNVSESVALDYYSEQSTVLLEATNQQTLVLEKRGKLDISGNNLKKFIGKTINLKNRITENLYILDSPPGTWDDENLYKIDTELKKTFDIQSRYRDIHEELQIIKENLGLLIDLMHQRKSSMLEWIVILLILVEVINLLFEKIV
ncbi:MAG: RMD1 family protein [Bacteroidota bacterium]